MKSVTFDASVLRQLRALDRGERGVAGKAIQLAQEVFGQPHRHTGPGVRKLRGDFYELRIGLGRRLVFENAPETLHFVLFGDHRAGRDDLLRRPRQ